MSRLAANEDNALRIRAQSLIGEGRWAEARPLLVALHERNPNERVLLYALCEAEILAGDAASALRRLEPMDVPGDVEAAFLRARALAALGRDAEARDALAALAARLPTVSANVEIHLAMAEQRLGHHEAALASLQRAVTAAPRDAELRVRLARAQATLARPADVRRSLADAKALAPARAATWLDIGRLHAELFEWQAAREALETGHRIDPGIAALELLLSLVLDVLGDPAAAQAAAARAAAADPGNLEAAVAQRLALPAIHEDAAHLARSRQRFASGLAELVASTDRFLPRAAEVFELKRSNFLLAYQGEDDRTLQADYSRFLATLTRAAWPAAHEPRPVRYDGGRRLRVGFASSFFRECTVGRYFARWITDLDSKRFERFLYHGGALADDFTRQLAASCDHFALVRGGAVHAARRILADELDVLVYPEVGMDPAGLLLATLRLAPVQLAAWGHPVTTGSANIDGYLSVAGMEPADAASHYVEPLLLLPGPGVRYALPPPAPARSRAEFGLPVEGRLYACPQSLFKIHPDMDAIFAELLARDREALLLFFQGDSEASTARFAQRLQRALARHGVEPRGQLKFIPRLGAADFRALLATCDVVLDTAHWSGGNTSFDAFAAGVPVVALPGRFMRGRQTAAMLEAMDLGRLAASSASQYVELALRLAQDRDENRATREAIARGRDAIFERPEPVRALGERLLAAAGRMAQ